MRAISTAATGMQAQETKLEQIANDMANMGTTGFKKGRTEFHDLFYQTVKAPAGIPGVNEAPVGVQIGAGSRVAGSYAIFDQGPLQVTNGMFDLAINGDGFFQVQQKDGSVAYTRAGTFNVNRDRQLVDLSGRPVVPAVSIPSDTAGVTITADGEILVMTTGGQDMAVGKITLATFVNPGALQKLGGNNYGRSPAAGEPKVLEPGTSGAGALQQGAIEKSNVNPTESVMEMISAQRMYEGNARMMGVADKTWETTLNVGR